MNKYENLGVIGEGLFQLKTFYRFKNLIDYRV